MYAKPHPNVVARRIAAQKQAAEERRTRNLAAMRRVGGCR